MTDDTNLGSSFGDKGTNVNQIAYGHPHADGILEGAREIISESAIGRALLNVQDHFKIPVSVIKGSGESGYEADMNVIFIQTSGATKTVTPEIVISYVKALREADLDKGGNKAPDPMKDVIGYAAFLHGRNLDTIVQICKFMKELSNSSYFQDLLDTLPKIGLYNVYKAYNNGASEDELYDVYADSYEAIERRGNI